MVELYVVHSWIRASAEMVSEDGDDIWGRMRRSVDKEGRGRSFAGKVEISFSLVTSRCFENPVSLSSGVRFELDKMTHEQLANLGLRSAFSANDVALALLRMVAFNIGQIAFLNSKR